MGRGQAGVGEFRMSGLRPKKLRAIRGRDYGNSFMKSRMATTIASSPKSNLAMLVKDGENQIGAVFDNLALNSSNPRTRSIQWKNSEVMSWGHDLADAVLDTIANVQGRN